MISARDALGLLVDFLRSRSLGAMAWTAAAEEIFVAPGNEFTRANCVVSLNDRVPVGRCLGGVVALRVTRRELD